MPYKNKAEQLASQRKWYSVNSEKEKLRVYTRRGTIREWYREYKKTLSCAECPESDWRCLDFHHRDRNSKSFTLATACNGGVSIKTLLEEIKKCDVLCANCHRKKTIAQDII